MRNQRDSVCYVSAAAFTRGGNRRDREIGRSERGFGFGPRGFRDGRIVGIEFGIAVSAWSGGREIGNRLKHTPKQTRANWDDPWCKDRGGWSIAGEKGLQFGSSGDYCIFRNRRIIKM